MKTRLDLRHKVILITKGLILLILWWWFSLNINSTSYQKDLALILTVFFAVFINREYPDTKDRLIFIAPCTIYFLLFWMIFNGLEIKLKNPFNVYYIGLLLFTFKKIRMDTTISILILLLLGKNILAYQLKSYNFPEERFEISAKKIVDTQKNLFSYKFINSDNDTIKLIPNNKPFLIETWAEWCRPCLKAIELLPDVLESSNIEYNQIYLYSDKKFKKLKDRNNVFNFNEIKNQESILAMSGLEFKEDFDLTSMPRFLLFEPGGKLDTLMIGFSESEIDVISDTLINRLNKLNLNFE